MTIDYNQGRIAEQYKQAKQQPWRARVEAYSFLKRIGDLRGKRVVDLACGAGHITRQLRQAGAASVVGMDISERMVELARKQEADDPLGIDYLVADARQQAPQGDFDLAVSAWLLVYAHDRAELGQMCRGVASWLRPGGRFVTFTTNPELYHFLFRGDYRKYGFEILLDGAAHDGAPILWRIHLEDSSLDIENYYLPVTAYEAAFREAGFRDFQVHGLQLSPNPEQGDDAAYWDDLLKFPPAIIMEGTRA